MQPIARLAAISCTRTRGYSLNRALMHRQSRRPILFGSTCSRWSDPKVILMHIFWVLSCRRSMHQPHTTGVEEVRQMWKSKALEKHVRVCCRCTRLLVPCLSDSLIAIAIYQLPAPIKTSDLERCDTHTHTHARAHTRTHACLMLVRDLQSPVCLQSQRLYLSLIHI